MIPPELREYPNWVCWRIEHKGDRDTKIPYDPKTNRRASSTDPRTWGTHKQAVQAQKEHGYDGIGFNFTNTPLTGIDLDDMTIEEAQPILDLVPTYTERSPSGRGYHLIARATIPGPKRRKGKIEMYEEGRYFTVTGDHVAGTPTRPQEIDLTPLYESVFGPINPPEAPHERVSAPTMPDTDIMSAIERSKQADAFRDLWEGDTSKFKTGDNNGHSEADLALVGMLYFWTGGNEQKTDEMFRQSGLMRAKWDEPRGDLTYGEITIRKAATTAREVYNPTPDRGTGITIRSTRPQTIKEQQKDASHNEFPVVWMGDVQTEIIEFLWEPYIPLRKITFLAGDPGSKKTFLAINIAAAVTRGAHPHTGTNDREPHPILYFTMEDGLADTIRPRAEAAGANLRLFGAVDHIRITTEDGEIKRGTASLEWTQELDDLLAATKPRLIIFDPIQSFIGATVDLNRANEVRPVLENVGFIAAKHDCAVLFVAHLNKGTGVNALYRMLGSIDLVGVSRSVLLVSSVNGQSMMIHEKANVTAKGEAIEYDITNGRVEFGRTHEIHSMDEVGGNNDATDYDEAVNFCLLQLDLGPMTATDLDRVRKLHGITPVTFQRARAQLRKDTLIDYRKIGYRGDVWWYRLDRPEPDWEEVTK